MILNSVKIDTLLRRGAGRLLLLGAVCLTSVLSSCDYVKDDLPECVMGVSLQFRYEYNMLRADAFGPEVDCVTVFVLDKDYNFVKSVSETTRVLQDPDYRMPVELEPGDYHLVVYGGLTCENAAFEFAPNWITTRAGGGTIDDIRVSLPYDANGVSKKMLHDLDKRTGGLFYGTHDLTIDYVKDFNGVKNRVDTVYMMKDNNNIQVILQELNGPDKIDVADYDFELVDDNFLLDGHNNIISLEAQGVKTSYLPFASENRLMGYVDVPAYNGAPAEESEEKQVKVACVEFATSRLVEAHLQSARLRVTSHKQHTAGEEPKVIIDIPFITYLAMARPFSANWIKGDAAKGITPTQEYLDRESSWTMMFFLQNDKWIKTHICVNSWVVRINDIDLGL
ncbi:MAG: FimB/Mfa2 family fimbrial subunit [Muribaculaceae bacterium]|nr:FimB/Mfa2 family fimbrial subunit [Muribaculaceae bacterium]